MREASKTEFLGIPISAECSIDQLLSGLCIQPESSRLVSFINPYAWHIARQDSNYTDNLNQLDLVLVDGIGVIKALKWINNIECQRLAFDFTSIAGPVFETCSARQLPIAIIGGKPGVSKATAEKLSFLYPELKILSHWSGFGTEPEKAIASCAQNAPAVVICGMGSPRQEEFLLKLKASGWVGTGFSCGGFFDQLLDTKQYYPEWIDKNNLRFLYRLYREPRRLGKRYFIEYLPFIKKAVKARFIYSR